MEKERKINTILKGISVIEGAGVRLKRVFGRNEVPDFDPFLMFDDFRSDMPEHYLKGFPWHPHRGIETITYVLKGDVEHRDSMGNTGVISAGDVQWMTAGSGIIHQEMPQGDADGSMHGFQLWANLPSEQKMMPPRYNEIKAADIPEIVLENGVTVHVIAGSVNGVKGPMSDIVIDPEYLDCTIPAGESYTHKTHPDYTAFIYVTGGKGKTCDADIDNGTLVLFESGESLTVSASDESVRFLLLTGKPLKEPVAWEGPIVMNTEAELREAFTEYSEGTFIKHK